MREFLHDLPHPFTVSCTKIITDARLLIVDGDEILTEDIAGDGSLDCFDAVLAQIRLLRPGRPDEHMHVRMVFLIVIRRVPAQISRRNPHRLRDIVSSGAEQIHPLTGGVVAQPLGILTLQGEDQPPHVAGVTVDLCLDLRENDRHTFVGEESVRASALADIVRHAAAREHLHAFARRNVFRITAARAAVLRRTPRRIVRRFQY